MEQTFILIKPDGVLIGLAGLIIPAFDKEGFTLKGLKMINVDRPLAEKHFQDVPGISLSPHLVNYICSGPVVAMIWEGSDVVSAARKIIEKTISSATDMDTDNGSNLIHVSNSLESANKEIALWFPDGPVKLPSAVAKPKDCDIGRISVTGFDSVLRDEDVESALRVHFASCGQITDVFIGDRTRCCVAYIYFVGEGAVDKALKLSGSDVNGEWNVCAEAYPFRDHKSTVLTVQGYAPSLTESQIKRLLVKHFSSSDVEVTSVTVFERLSMVSVKGLGAVDKALELSGSYVKGRKVLVKCHGKPPRYTVHDRRAPYHYFTRIQK